MSGRVYIGAFVLFFGCDDRSAVLDFSPQTIRVATTPGLNIEELTPKPAIGAAGPASELFFEAADAYFTVGAPSGRFVRLDPKYGSADLQVLADLIHFEGLVGVRNERDHVVAEFSDEEVAKDFGDSGGLATGPFDYRSITIGGAQVFAARDQTGVPAQLVGARWDAHWQLLLGDQVDVAPNLQEQHAAYIDKTDGIHIVSKPLGVNFTLVINPRKTTIEGRRALLQIVSGDDSPVDLGQPFAIPTVLIRDDDESATAEYRKLANRIWRKTGQRPAVDRADSSNFQRRVVGGQFEVVLAPITDDPRVFLPWLLPGGSLGGLGLASDEVAAAIRAEEWELAESLLAEYVVKLGEIREYVAYGAEWCGDVKPEPYSWKWIADLRRCENGQ